MHLTNRAELRLRQLRAENALLQPSDATPMDFMSTSNIEAAVLPENQPNATTETPVLMDDSDGQVTVLSPFFLSVKPYSKIVKKSSFCLFSERNRRNRFWAFSLYLEVK